MAFVVVVVVAVVVALRKDLCNIQQNTRTSSDF